MPPLTPTHYLQATTKLLHSYFTEKNPQRNTCLFGLVTADDHRGVGEVLNIH